MVTIKERAEAALKIYTSEDTPQYDEFADGIQAGQAHGFKDGYIVGAEEQKAIDDAELHQRFEKVLNGQKWDLIDTFREWLNDHIAEYIRHTEKGDFLAPCIFRDLFEAMAEEI